jgi:hypothetical protein
MAVCSSPLNIRSDSIRGTGGAVGRLGGSCLVETRIPLRSCGKVEVWSPEAARIYAQAAGSQWDPATAIPWDAEVDLPDEVEDAVVQTMTCLVKNETAPLIVSFAGGNQFPNIEACASGTDSLLHRVVRRPPSGGINLLRRKTCAVPETYLPDIFRLRRRSRYRANIAPAAIKRTADIVELSISRTLLVRSGFPVSVSISQ